MDHQLAQGSALLQSLQSCCIRILILLFFSGLIASIFGCIISSGIEWGKIRYDYSDLENNNHNAYILYIMVTLSWVTPIIFVAHLNFILFSGICKIPSKVVDRFLAPLLAIISLLNIAFNLCCVVYTSSGKCQEIRKIGTQHGQSSESFQRYIKDKMKNVPENQREEWMKSFDEDRCEGFHTLITVFVAIHIPLFFILVAFFCICQKSFANRRKKGHAIRHR